MNDSILKRRHTPRFKADFRVTANRAEVARLLLAARWEMCKKVLLGRRGRRRAPAVLAEARQALRRHGVLAASTPKPRCLVQLQLQISLYSE